MRLNQVYRISWTFVSRQKFVARRLFKDLAYRLPRVVPQSMTCKWRCIMAYGASIHSIVGLQEIGA